jgi:hypothetical protein
LTSFRSVRTHSIFAELWYTIHTLHSYSLQILDS